MFYKYRCVIKRKHKDGLCQYVTARNFLTEQEATDYGEDQCEHLCYIANNDDAYVYSIFELPMITSIKQDQSSAYKKSLLALRDQLVKTLEKLDQLIDDA